MYFKSGCKNTISACRAHTLTHRLTHADAQHFGTGPKVINLQEEQPDFINVTVLDYCPGFDPMMPLALRVAGHFLHLSGRLCQKTHCFIIKVKGEPVTSLKACDTFTTGTRGSSHRRSTLRYYYKLLLSGD